jgi:hypothetical protein
MAKKDALVKLFLHKNHSDVESVWGEKVGKVRGGTLVRLDNVPFLHAKPTYGDVVVAKRDKELEVDFAFNIPHGTVHADGGRHAAIVDYTMAKGASFARLSKWLHAKLDVVPEGCFGPDGKEPGRLYLAIPEVLKTEDVVGRMAEHFPKFRFVQIHPKRTAKLKRKR